MLQISSSSSSKSSATITMLRKLFLRRFCTTNNNNLLSTLSNQNLKLNHLPSVSRNRNDKKLPNFPKIIPYPHRSQAIKQAQEVLTEYFQNTRALPSTFAENISKNSKHCLYELLSKVPFSSSGYSNTLQRFLRYNPINEFRFFYESIGIDYAQIDGFLNPNLIFLSDDSSVLEAASCLAGFGFPWGVLGKLYVEEVSIFSKKHGFLRGRLDGLISLGFDKQQVVGACLVFPCLLKGEEVNFGGEIDGLLDDLKRVFVGFDLGVSGVGSVDVWIDFCRKIRVFYDLGIAKGEVGKLICGSEGNFGKCILSDYSEEVLVEKVEFFSRLGFEKTEIGLLILSNPNVLSIKIHDRVISVSSLLDYFGLPNNTLLSLKQNYGHVFDRNKMVNLPNILKALDLHEWFYHRMKCGYHSLFATYDLSTPDDGVDESYAQKLETIKSARMRNYSFGKLDFFHGIGFGENNVTMKLLVYAKGSPTDLHKRFEFMLNKGIQYSTLCSIISRGPKVFGQEIDTLEKKLDFLVEEIGLPLDYLEIFPSYLTYNLETRIKPRFKFQLWLTEQGWCTKKHSLATIISHSHKSYVELLSRIHPTAPQLWLERHKNGKNK